MPRIHLHSVPSLLRAVSGFRSLPSTKARPTPRTRQLDHLDCADARILDSLPDGTWMFRNVDGSVSYIGSRDGTVFSQDDMMMYTNARHTANTLRHRLNGGQDSISHDIEIQMQEGLVDLEDPNLQSRWELHQRTAHLASAAFGLLIDNANVSMEDGRTAVVKWLDEVSKLNQDRILYFSSCQERVRAGPVRSTESDSQPIDWSSRTESSNLIV